MRAYYINVDSKTGRRRSMERQLAKLGLPFERMRAVTPGDIGEDDRRRYCDPRRFHWLTEGELACSLSHVSVMERFVDSGEPFCLVLEDDVRLSASLKRVFQAFEKAPPKLDILRIEDSTYPLRLARHPSYRFDDIGMFPLFSWCAGSAGYFISRQGAKRVIAGKEIRKTQADRAMFNPYEPLARELIILQSLPGLCRQDNNLETQSGSDAGSDLEAGRQDRFERERVYAFRRFLFNVGEFVDRDLRIGLLKFWHQTIGGAAKREVPFKVD